MNTAAIALICALVSAFGPQHTPPPLAAGTAILRGQVTDGETGAPIPHAVVRVETLRADRTRFVRQQSTNQEGRFEFRNLPSGLLQVSATGGEHRATHIHEYYPPRGGRSGGPPLVLKDGEVRADVKITLRRSLAVSGRVTDELGMPLAGVTIRLGAADGGYLQHSVSQRWTDDRGVYRLFGVPPGDYVVCADIEQGPAMSRLNVASLAERFVNTCHPSALADAEAQVVSVRSADVDGIEIRVRRSRTFTISGTTFDSTGAPADSPRIMLNHYGRDRSSGSGGVMPGGRFEFSGLVPGQYGVDATVGGDEWNWPRGPFTERGYVAVSIDGADVTGLVVAMRKPATVRGRVTFEDGAPAAREGEPLTIEAQPAVRSPGPQPQPARVADDLSFTLAGFFGPARLSVRGIPRGWVVKSIRYREEDITERAAEFSTDPRDRVEITLTSRVAVVTGTVTDDRGNPAVPATVYLLPADPKQASTELHHYRSYAVLRDGRFNTGGIRAADYAIIAIGSEQAEALRRQRPTVDRLVKYAERISLVENDRLTMNLRVVTLPGVR